MLSRWSLLWRLPWLLVTWATVEGLIFMPLFIVGAVMAPLAFAVFPTYAKPSRIFPEMMITAFSWSWADAWLGNYEDGLAPFWWCRECGGMAGQRGSNGSSETRSPTCALCHLSARSQIRPRFAGLAKRNRTESPTGTSSHRGLTACTAGNLKPGASGLAGNSSLQTGTVALTTAPLVPELTPRSAS